MRPLHTRTLINSAFVLACTAGSSVLASPPSHRSIVLRHVYWHNEQGDVSPFGQPRTGCRHGAPWFGGLGHLPAGFQSDALAVSPDGIFVVGASSGVDPNSGSGAYLHAVAWNGCTGLSTMGSTPVTANWSAAFAISNTSRHVAGMINLNDSDLGFDAAALWLSTSDGVDVLWNPELGPYQRTRVNGVSAEGTAFAGTAEDSDGMEAFVYTLGSGSATMLGDLPGGQAASQANAISHNGNGVVGMSSSSRGLEAFRWVSGQGMEALGDLPGGAFESSALAVSADGSVVVGYATTAAGQAAFRWTAQTGMVSLGDLPGGAEFSEALAVSADGSIIVGRSSSMRGDEAFIWSEATGMRSLRDVAAGQFPAEFTAWQLTAARGISDDGIVIVGSGINPQGDSEGWVLELGRACRADWNQDGDVNSSDFFGFITGFFMDAGDFTGDGRTDTRDYFDFLTAFFAGC